MTISPIMTIGGVDVSRFVLKVHSEQTSSIYKDPGKFDVDLANINGRFFGAFGITDPEEGELIGLNPNTVIDFKVRITTDDCRDSGSKEIQIFRGEAQHVNVDELTLSIQGGCSESGMTSTLKQHHTFPPGKTITFAVNALLDDFGIPSNRRVVEPYNNQFPDKTPEFEVGLDFDNAFADMADQAQSIYFFDEMDVFHFIPATDIRGSVDVTGNILRGTSAKTMEAHCNFITVFGGVTELIKPEAPFSEIKSHALVIAEAKDDESIEECGTMRAPIVYVPNCNQEECQKIADNLLTWYKQYQDNPTIKLSGRAPRLLSRVTYRPWNGAMTSSNCESSASAGTSSIVGFVIKRVVDFDANGGFTSQLDLATNPMDLGDATGLAFPYDPFADIDPEAASNPLAEVADTI
jgi:hypothetical protein